MSDKEINYAIDRDESERQAKTPWLVWALCAGLIASFGLLIWQNSNLGTARQEIASMSKEIEGLKQAVATSGGTVAERLAALRQEMETTKQEALQSSEVAKKAAISAANRQARAVASKVQTVQQQQDEQGKMIEARFNEMKSSSDQTVAKLTDISTEVGTVKTEVATNKSDIDKVASELRRTVGDLGVMSGLIATNSKELAALREIGERDYLEFRLPKNKELHRVGDVLVKVKKVDPKRNRYTMELVADDKKVEKKDRNINEPVQFYVLSKARQPYELVVNEVNKNQVVGYLAVPKLKLAARN